jgi:hypothetical protein
MRSGVSYALEQRHLKHCLTAQICTTEGYVVNVLGCILLLGSKHHSINRWLFLQSNGSLLYKNTPIRGKTSHHTSTSSKQIKFEAYKPSVSP